MKKRLLCILLTATALLALMGAFSVSAGAEEAPVAVAQVGSTTYTSIDDAVAAWTAGTALTLLDDVTLSDVIKISSKEHHTLNLGTHTLTAASGKNAIEITPDDVGTKASACLTINADPAAPGGITAKGKACIYYRKTSNTNDRMMVTVNGGVFNGSSAISSSSSNRGQACPYYVINGGTFNASVSLTHAMLKITGGTFNGTLLCTGDSTAYRLISGGSFKNLTYMTADASNKFVIGSAKGVYDVGVHIDENGYLVVGGPVITEPGTAYEASTAYSTWNSYLKYSSAAANGLYWVDADKAMAKNSSGSVAIHAPSLDLTDSSFKGTLMMTDEGKTLAITLGEGETPAWKVDTDLPGKTVAYTVTAASGTVTRAYSVVDEHTISFETNGGSSLSDLPAADGYTASEPTTPTKEGYTFSGWYTDAACSEGCEWSFDTDVVTEDVTLYARWTLNTYTVTVDYGAALGTDSFTVDHGTLLDLHNPAFGGYIFMGWYDDSDFSAAHDFTAPVTGDLTLYARLVDYDKAIKDLTDAIDAASNAIDTKADASALATVTADLAAAKVSIETLLDQIDDYTDADTALKSELLTLIDTSDALIRQSVSELTDRVTLLEGKIADAQARIAANEGSIVSLTADLEILKAWKQAAETTLADLTALTDKHTADIAALEDAVRELKDTLLAADTDITDAEARLDAVEDKISEFEEARISLAIALARMNTAIEQRASSTTLNDALTELWAAIEALEAAKDSYVGADAQLKAELLTTMNELQAAVTALESARKDYVNADAALKAELLSAIEAAKQSAINAARSEAPYIGENGNWWIAGSDTGICATAKESSGAVVAATTVGGVALAGDVALLAWLLIKRKKAI